MSIKLIVMDVDGTLTNSKKIITDKTKEDLIKVQEDGILLVLASGRPTSVLMDLRWLIVKLMKYYLMKLWVYKNAK